MSPRPILKQCSVSPDYPIFPFAKTSIPIPASSSCISTPHVHFPPTPKLSQTYVTYSGKTYDRAPITVTPNNCELPERGCPGRTYDVCDDRDSVNFSYFLSRAREGLDTSDGSPHMSRLPPLIADTSSSSESDESDTLLSPPNQELPSSPFFNQDPLALAFLPHAPSPPRQWELKRQNANTREGQFKSEQATRDFAASSLEGCFGGF